MYKQKRTSLQLASASTVTSVPSKNVQTKMYIFTTGIEEHRGIGTLKICNNKNVHDYKWQSPHPPISPFFDANGNKNIGATISIDQEIWCLPYAGFLHCFGPTVSKFTTI